MQVRVDIGFRVGGFDRFMKGKTAVLHTRNAHEHMEGRVVVRCANGAAFEITRTGSKSPHFENMLALFGTRICDDFLTHIGVGQYSLSNISPSLIEVNGQAYLASFTAGGSSWTLSFSLPNKAIVAERSGIICW